VPDAYDAFAQGSASRKQMLERFWPELYNALARVGEAGSQRAMWCVLGDLAHVNQHHPAVGRITRMGHPACQAHIDRLADRRGGWPLPAVENERKR
jgi:hypothetical protein